jgi:hypothetical protein
MPKWNKRKSSCNIFIIDQGESVFVQVVSAVVIFSYILFSMSFGGTL